MFTHVPRQIHVLTYTLLDVHRFALLHTFVKTAENLIELGFSLLKNTRYFEYYRFERFTNMTYLSYLRF